MDEIPKYLTTKDVAIYYKNIFTKDAVKNLFYNRRSNGLAKYVKKVGKKRLVIKTVDFEKWLESKEK
ncbi:MAG: hypothetical protein ACTSO3_15970 [Candidatus Heimdallarchaeaceae archaeon]